MLSFKQFLVLLVMGVAFWALATAQIRWMPDSIIGPIAGSITFVTSVPAGWLSVWLTQRCASLSKGQLPTGILVAGAIAMMIDGAVLHWAPGVYGKTETTVRLGAAWLLWGYGVAFVIAFIVSRVMTIDAQNVSTAGQ